MDDDLVAGGVLAQVEEHAGREYDVEVDFQPEGEGGAEFEQGGQKGRGKRTG